ncbi:MAG TPA: methylmalonyl Co-A mutase-associated GTPase MeaB [Polyangiaceae bacterium]|nr:MAG: methylmalonyl Co-A mutase-associated GTPase MeaB [Pseudomonadota bacterium]HLV68977.1 methylmalonyl Co-A mutase-associated GTPase MeaB [Polyangiaceae bacterium]
MRLDPSALAEGVRSGNRAALARAITLVESRLAAHVEAAERVLELLFPHTGRALRLGITGPPGAGKSTLVDALGLHAIEQGHRVGVLAIDPTSERTGGSLLGDRTRMGRLAARDEAFVRPSPSGGVAGGLGPRTREAMIVLEAGGYDVIVVESVGVGQGEIAITDVVDVVLVLLLSGAGDALQGMKRGLLEHADLVAFTKADGARRAEAQAARDELASLFTWLRPDGTPVLTVSALSGDGVPELWSELGRRKEALTRSGALDERRRRQRRAWLSDALEQQLLARYLSDPDLARRKQELEAEVERGALLPPVAARRLLPS